MPYNVYLPSVIKGRPGPLRGIALGPPKADADLLNVSWRYNWFHKTDKFAGARGEFVPMLKDGLPSNEIPSTYAGPLLAMNEPDNPVQLNISPDEAAARMQKLRAAYPQARIIAPACLSYSIDWLQRFYDAGQHPDAWALHAYVEGPYNVDAIIGQLNRMHQLTGGTAWITEFGVMSGDLEVFKRLVTWMTSQEWIERIAAYTNRQPYTNDWWVVSHGVDLVKQDGILTECGKWYRDN